MDLSPQLRVAESFHRRGTEGTEDSWRLVERGACVADFTECE